MNNCIFCKISKKEIPCYNVYEDDDVIAFLDLSQTCYGHTLVIPKKHYENFIDVESTTLNKVMIVAQKVARSLIKELKAKGVNIISNVNEQAGQSVFHFHVHVIPRYDESDGLKISYRNNGALYDQEKMNALASKLKKGI